MRLALLALAVACAGPTRAQPPAKPDISTTKPEDAAAKKEQAQPTPAAPRPRPRVTLKPKGGTGSAVGDDAPGGGATTAEPSKGGTSGTPSGSFTGKAPGPR